MTGSTTALVLCDPAGQQRTLRRDRDGWWVVVDPRSGEAHSGGFRSRAEALTELRRLTAAAPPAEPDRCPS